MSVTNITDYQGNCIQDSNNTCIILNTHVPIFGCGAVFARIWRAGKYLDVDFIESREPITLPITEL